MKRRTFIKNSGIALGAVTVSPLLSSTSNAYDYNFPLMDLHVHLTNEFTLKQVMSIP